jgi:hypothetical protein
MGAEAFGELAEKLHLFIVKLKFIKLSHIAFIEMRLPCFLVE